MKVLCYVRKTLGVKGLLVTFLALLLMGVLVMPVAFAENGQAQRQKIVQQVAAKWIQVGLEQYDRGYYKASEQSFLRAKDYEDYLSAEQRQQLNELLQKSHAAVAELQKTEAAEEAPAKVEAELTPQQAEIAQLYNQSVDYYNSGNLEAARKGFLEVAKSNLMIAPEGSRAEDYLANIDAQLAGQVITTEPATAEIERELFGAADEAAKAAGIAVAPEAVQPLEAQIQVQPMPVTAEPITVEPVTAEPETTGGGYIEVINRRQNILRSHTKAVVGDALAKARSFNSENEFDQATKAVDYAQNIVNKNRLHLGEQLFEQYSHELQRQREEIETAQNSRQTYVAEQKRIEAAEQQEKVRTQMQTDRQKRIAELMENAMAYQKQQRYEEALGQLHSLLAIEPLNNYALILKDTLEDTIGFRKQLELQKEKQRERAGLLLETGESEVPYAKEITYPKNWREISAKRTPEEAIGRDPATVRVYEQLEQVVDLSEFNSDMQFSEAIEILKNSVDPSLKIIVMWRDLYDNADIDQTTPINMDPISAIRLGSALKLLLEAVSGGFAELGYAVENGIITIATEESLPSELITLVYDVTDLVQSPAEYRTNISSSSGGGGGGVSDVGGGFQDSGDDQEQDREQLREERTGRVGSLILLIQDTVAPDSWFDTGGDGTITSYAGKLMSVRQTAEIHNQVNSLLKELRKAHGYQVAIEARFLTVQENFLEEIGLDVDVKLFHPGGKGSLGPIGFNQRSSTVAASSPSGVTGSFGGSFSAANTAISALTGSYGAAFDDLQIDFLLRASQVHQDNTILTAPKATVLSGESATFRVERLLYYAGDIETETTEGGGDNARGYITVDYEDRSVSSGTTLNVTPTITPDKRHVLLNIDATLSDFLGFRVQTIDVPTFGDIAGGAYSIEFPQTEVSQIRTRVSVPDRGTLLLGGQKIGAEFKKEAGVPILSKIPILGRAFRNTSEVKDHKILLILIKPTIILREEAEADAIAAMEENF